MTVVLMEGLPPIIQVVLMQVTSSDGVTGAVGTYSVSMTKVASQPKICISVLISMALVQQTGEPMVIALPLLITTGILLIITIRATNTRCLV